MLEAPNYPNGLALEPSDQLLSRQLLRGSETQVISYVLDRNPRRSGTAGYNNWSRYRVGMSLKEYAATGGTFNHLKWDLDHGYVTVVRGTTFTVPTGVNPTWPSAGNGSPATLPRHTTPSYRAQVLAPFIAISRQRTPEPNYDERIAPERPATDDPAPFPF